MRRRLARGRLVWGGAALVVALVASAAGVVPAGADPDPAEATPLSVPGMAVSLAQAGELAVWGSDTLPQSTVPPSLADVAVSQVVFPPQAGLALTADGHVVGWGSNQDRLEQVPEAVASTKVAQIATQGGYAGAVTRDGRVLMWGKKRAFATPLDVPPDLTGVKQLALTDYAAAALKDDGTVVAWGQTDWDQTKVPVGLKATMITAGYQWFYALTEQGTVTNWGLADSGRGVQFLQEPGSVKAVAASYGGALALMADNTLVQFGWPDQAAGGVRPVPADVASVDPVLLANSGGTHEFAIVDSDRTIHYWKSPTSDIPGEVPPELNGRELAQIVLGTGVAPANHITGGVIITKMLRAELPQVTGTAQVGSVLTGVAGTFSAAPDSVTSQWLVGGEPSGSGTQLTLTEAMAGKTISYQSIATKAGETTVFSTSNAVTVTKPTPPPVVPVPSTTKVAKVTVAKKAASVTVTGKVTASKSPTGKAKVTIKKGKKTIVTKTVGVSAAGAVKLSVKKFAKLVAKKLKAKGKKAKTAYRGKYQVTISYTGNTQVKASSGSGRFTIKK